MFHPSSMESVLVLIRKLTLAVNCTIVYHKTEQKRTRAFYLIGSKRTESTSYKFLQHGLENLHASIDTTGDFVAKCYVHAV